MRWNLVLGFSLIAVYLYGAITPGMWGWTAFAVGNAMVIVDRILRKKRRPTLWQLRHPCKAWWMASKGYKLVEQYEYYYAEDVCHISRELEQIRSQRERDVEIQRVRDETIKRWGISFAGVFDQPKKPKLTRCVRIHIPSYARNAYGLYDGIKGTIIDTRLTANGEMVYLVVVADGLGVQIPSEYCVRIPKEAQDGQ